MTRQAESVAAPVGLDAPVALLDDDGAYTPNPAVDVDPRAIDGPAMYRDMVLTRRIDTEAIALQRQGELGLWPSLLGQEAAQVGAASAATDRDVVFPTYREHGVAWCRGVDPVNLFGIFRGTTLGGWDPASTGVQLYTLVIGAQTLHAVGYGMGLVRDGVVGSGVEERDRAVLVFLGDGAFSEGETNEAFVWAAAFHLPVVFFCQNNQWAISAPVSVQSRVPLVQRATGFGIRGIRVDGNDPYVCRAVTDEALSRARAGGGPTLVEAVTYRRNPHTTSDDDGRYRAAETTAGWEARDPIERMRRHLTATGEIDDAFHDRLDAEADALAVRLRDGCRALADPDPRTPFLTTLGETTAELRVQMDDMLDFLDPDEHDR